MVTETLAASVKVRVIVSDNTVSGMPPVTVKNDPVRLVIPKGKFICVIIAPKTAGVDVEIPVPVEENDDDVNVVNPSWPVSLVGFCRII